MATKASQPAPYEKMRSGYGGIAPPASAAERHAPVSIRPSPIAVGSPTDTNVRIGPGRVLRVPAGFLLLACGFVVLCLALSYMVGHRRGFGAAKTEYEKLITATSVPVNDPLGSFQPVVETLPAAGASNAKPATPNVTPNSTIGRNEPSDWKPVIPAKDPRKKGLNYFVLAQTSEQGSKTLAEFCRSNGLETYVVAGNNDRSRRVIAFPGFEASARTSSEIKALEAKIHSIGDKWKKNKGTTDLHDAYASLYGG